VRGNRFTDAAYSFSAANSPAGALKKTEDFITTWRLSEAILSWELILHSTAVMRDALHISWLQVCMACMHDGT
jgi:hypothetical protein